jgi:hypothetical protein
MKGKDGSGLLQCKCFLGAVLSLGIIAGSISISPAGAQSTPPTPKPEAGMAGRYQQVRVSKREREYFSLIWGVDLLNVKAVESGELIRFTYRVLDPAKAKIFNDEKIEASLISPTAHAALVIPSLEKVGKLRQRNTPVAGKSYWMAFSNPRRTVKPGDRVNVVIGQFHADGLVVE